MTLWTRRPQCYIILLHWGPVRKEPTMERRKDSKGRVLKKGESERKDGRYQYRYIDAWKKRQTIYASDLKELREKEAQIQKDIDDGINYAEGKIKVYDFLKEYFDSKKIYQVIQSYRTMQPLKCSSKILLGKCQRQR